MEPRQCRTHRECVRLARSSPCSPRPESSSHAQSLTLLRCVPAVAARPVASPCRWPVGAPLPAASRQGLRRARRRVLPAPASDQGPPARPADQLGQVAKAGKDFAIVKATEGTTYVNPYFAGPYANDYADAAAAGLVHGSYHFARPALPVAASAKAQAKFFADDDRTGHDEGHVAAGARPRGHRRSQPRASW